jgi:MFS transporter, DHA1 family, multidrug resistance protein
MISTFIGGFIVTSHLGWRWTQYLPGILAVVAAVLNYLFVYETYPPIILVEKANELRRRTKNWAIHAKQEEVEVSLNEIIERNFTRPLHMLVVEPIVLFLGYRYLFYSSLLDTISDSLQPLLCLHLRTSLSLLIRLPTHLPRRLRYETGCEWVT